MPEWKKMRRSDKEIKISEMEAFLQANCVGHLGTINSSGYPYVIPINFVYEQGKFIFHSARVGEKLDNIRANPRVCFEVSQVSGLVKNEKPCKFSANFTSVVAFGQASILEDLEKEKYLKVFTRRFTGKEQEGFLENDLEHVVLILMTVEHISGKVS